MKYRELTEKIIGCACIQSLQPNGLWFSVGLIINFGERKIEIKRKVKDFDEDLQDEF